MSNDYNNGEGAIAIACVIIVVALLGCLFFRLVMSVWYACKIIGLFFFSSATEYSKHLSTSNFNDGVAVIIICMMFVAITWFVALFLRPLPAISLGAIIYIFYLIAGPKIMVASLILNTVPAFYLAISDDPESKYLKIKEACRLKWKQLRTQKA